MDATAAITLAAGGEWFSFTLDVLFGKRDVYPGAVVLPNRSAGDAFVWYSKLFSYLYRFATVWLDTMRWQPKLGSMGMKGEEDSTQHPERETIKQLPANSPCKNIRYS